MDKPYLHKTVNTYIHTVLTNATEMTSLCQFPYFIFQNVYYVISLVTTEQDTFDKESKKWQMYKID